MSGERAAAETPGPGPAFVQELAPRRRDAASNLQRRRGARRGAAARRAKQRALQGDIEDDLDVSLAESAVKAAREETVFDRDGPDDSDADDHFQDDEDDGRGPAADDDEDLDALEGQGTASEDDAASDASEDDNAASDSSERVPKSPRRQRPAASSSGSPSPVSSKSRRSPARGKRPRPAEPAERGRVAALSSSSSSSSTGKLGSGGASSSGGPLYKVVQKNGAGSESEIDNEESADEDVRERSERRRPVAPVRKRKKRTRESASDDEEGDEREGRRAQLKPVKVRLTCLDIVHNLASVLVDEYAEELEQRGRPEYTVYLDRFLEEIRSEFAVYNTLAHEFASHARFSRALTRELQDSREELAWRQKQCIRAERLVSTKRAELARREAAKKEADAAEAYLARLNPLG